MRFDLARRLEPIRPVADLDRGFSAETADPAWFLARQWQMGEHQGEDAASPLRVSYIAAHQAIDPLDEDPGMDPRIVPAEAIIESEPSEWWTPGRRVRIGLAAAPHVPATHQNDPALRMARTPPPYDRFDDVAYDGFALYKRRLELGLPAAVFSGVPTAEPADLWDPTELTHSATFPAGPVNLRVPRHDGGDVDWYSGTRRPGDASPVAAPRRGDREPDPYEVPRRTAPPLVADRGRTRRRWRLPARSQPLRHHAAH